VGILKDRSVTVKGPHWGEEGWDARFRKNTRGKQEVEKEDAKTQKVGKNYCFINYTHEVLKIG